MVKHLRRDHFGSLSHSPKSLYWIIYVFFSFKNACAKKPCQNNSTCQAGFTDRDYQCLCSPGFTGHDCENGRRNTITPLYNGGVKTGIEMWLLLAC